MSFLRVLFPAILVNQVETKVRFCPVHKPFKMQFPCENPGLAVNTSVGDYTFASLLPTSCAFSMQIKKV